MKTSLTTFFFLLVLTIATQVKASGPAITYHGRIMKSDGTPLNAPTVRFKVQIRTSGAENCLMYEETLTKDLSASAGVFSISLNSGAGSRTDTSGYSFQDIFSNRVPFTFPSGTCSSGTTFSPLASSGRSLLVYFNDGTFTGWEPAPQQMINQVPQSIDALQVGGFTSDSLLRVANGSGPQTTTPLSPADYNELRSLVSGTSTLYVSNSGGGGGVGVSSLTVGSGLTAGGVAGGTLSGPGTIDLKSTGVAAGTYTKVTVDVKGIVQSAGNISASDLPTIPLATGVSGVLPIANGGTGKTSATEAFDALSPSTTKGDIPVFNGTDHVRLGVGANGYVLKADSTQSSGLVWSAPIATDIASMTTTGIVQRNGANSYSSVSVVSPLSYSAGTLTADVGTTAGKLVQVASGDKLPVIDGSNLTNLSLSQISSGTLPINKGGTGKTTASDSFDALAPTTTKGDVIVYDGTNNIRLPTGTNGNVLKADSSSASGLTWAAPIAVSSPLTYTAGTVGLSSTVTDALWSANSGNVYRSTGSVGIGTNSPSEKLEVVGKIKGTELCIDTDCRSAWPTSSGGTVTSITAGTGLSGGTITGSGTIALTASGVTANTYGSATTVPQLTVDTYGRVTSATDVTISGTDPSGAALTAGKIWVGNASNVAAAVSVSGDISMANDGSTTVTKIQNKAVSATAPNSSGQVLRYDGTTWKPNFISMFDLRSTVTGTATFGAGSTGCTAGETLTWTAATDNLACTAISLDASKIVSGTIDAARLPSSVVTSSGTTGYVPYLSSASALANSPLYVSGTAVGVGTTSPGDRFHIKQSASTAGLRIEESGSTSSTSLYQDSSSVFTINRGNSSTKLVSGGGGSYSVSVNNILGLYQDSAGKVAIGTSSPTSLFDVVNSNGRQFQVVDGGASTVNYLTVTGAATTLAPTLAAAGSDTDIPIAISAKGAGRIEMNASRVFLPTSNACLVVGSAYNSVTGCSGHTLTLGGFSNTAEIGMARNNTGSQDGKSLTVISGAPKQNIADRNGGDLILSSGISTGNGASSISFQTASAGTAGATTDNTPSTKMTILGSGWVGIGTTNPGASLEVQSTSASGNIRSSSTASLGILSGGSNLIMTTLVPTAANQRLGIIGFGGLSNSGGYYNFTSGITGWSTQAWSSGANGTALVFETTGNNNNTRSEKMRLDQNGYLGIGTANPNAPLHVSTTNVSGNIANFVSTGSGGAGCSISWNGTSCSSDIRLKENVQTVDLTTNLDQLLKVRTVHFTWIKDLKHEKQTGFIAQELEKLFPEYVKTDERGFKQVNYAHFVSVLTAGLQELHKKWSTDSADLHRSVASVEQDVSALRKENAELKARLEKQDRELQLIKQKLGL
ncbi:hypothetical protein AZI86_17110 [Bdellovibrio bacteriovorus]|uniref:Peptidase S74 domain-containing protein n=1 Tax=Bdellovibrio bacteriovorus TaxID=959 RepID=A0A150WER9_BDEBC|nr:tail fiber domain-containing protein [Bdellovibrio bacteriovorus]KYG61433.1 hypothetical protein AZI86_17110 [Bdellovibrio bacteriovorus]